MKVRIVMASLITVVVGCSDQVPLERTAPASSSEPGEIVLPPSAKVPRASLPGFTPDTIRPEGMIAPDTLVLWIGWLVEPGRSVARRDANRARQSDSERRS
jgi:hypothetical protein